MNKTVTVLVAGALVLVVSLGMLFAFILSFPSLMEEYYNPIFRSNSFQTDWLFYLHPFVLSAGLLWFWEHSKKELTGGLIAKALKTALSYGIIAMVPVLLLTFSAIDISALMVITWLGYGIAQAFIACLIFAKRHP
jgi:hypothetical protein